MNVIFLNIARFFFLVLLQVYVINNIKLGFLSDYISPIIYISFLFTLPLNISKYIVLFLAFFLGLTLDIFQDTYGIHASACVFLALIRPRLIESFKNETIEQFDEITILNQDRQKYIYYIFILTFAFFLWLFMLENFSLTNIPLILLKTIISSVFSSFLIILGQMLLFRK